MLKKVGQIWLLTCLLLLNAHAQSTDEPVPWFSEVKVLGELSRVEKALVIAEEEPDIYTVRVGAFEKALSGGYPEDFSWSDEDGLERLPENIRTVTETYKSEDAQLVGVTTNNINGELNLVYEKRDRQAKPYEHTSHAYGFIPVRDMQGSNQSVGIISAANINKSLSDPLKDKKVKITLDRLRVFDYPGKGIHHVLFDFYVRNQTQPVAENIHFNQTYRIHEGQQAGLIGLPIFIGLDVGREGLAFRILTVNVKNEDDEKLLAFLDEDVFKAGMKLLGSVNPAVSIASGYAQGLTKSLLKKNRNVPVQNIDMGLDFSSVSTRARLAEGSYIIMQVENPAAIDWSAWVYNPQSGEIVSKTSPQKAPPYNYFVLGVSEY